MYFPVKDESHQLSDLGIRGLTIFGILLIAVAVIMPFRVRNYFKSRIETYENIADLGPIGDFIGGTTVAFLTAASVILLLATIIMQRKEIKISQRSIDELVKQTDASVEQAQAAREEAKKTNETMKKQQFETTFFNMINLHHSILKEINIENNTGRDAIKQVYTELKNTYNKEIHTKLTNDLKKKALEGEVLLLEDLVEKYYISQRLNEFLEQNYTVYYPYPGEGSDEEWGEFYNSVQKGTNQEWNKKKAHYSEVLKKISSETILNTIDFNEAVRNNVSNVYVDEFKEKFVDNPSKEFKIFAYEKVYKHRENNIGHYYRNLYRLVKLIQEETFDMDKTEDEKQKRKYRGILRAQLSSFELLMIFYNVVYSKKGEKFKEILINTNFFDDHLIVDDFIWKNDIQELTSLDKQ